MLDASTRVAVAAQKAACSICAVLHGVVELSLRRWVLFRALSEDSSGSRGALSPLLPQQAQSESPCSTIPFLCINTRKWVTGRINRAHTCSVLQGSCIDLASLGRTCDADQLYTDAALVLDTSMSVAAVAGSGLIDLHLHCVVVHADGVRLQVASTVLLMTLRASRRSDKLSSYTPMQRSC